MLRPGNPQDRRGTHLFLVGLGAVPVPAVLAEGLPVIARDEDRGAVEEARFFEPVE